MPNNPFDVFKKYGIKAPKAENAAPKQKRYVTRIAPSPTGHAHIGTFRTAVFNYLAARASNGAFILRVDDTDTTRNDYKAIRPIREALEWLGLNPDYSFHQSERLERYRERTVELVNAGLAKVLNNGAIALMWHEGMPLEWTDNIAGAMKVSQTNIDQIDGRLILMTGKDKGYRPTYQFASTFDDWTEKVNYIIRGTDHISNTPKQLAIWWALNQTRNMYSKDKAYPEFAHLGLIFKDGKKLSKRDGAASVLEWRDKGYTAEALNAFMLRLGWAPKEDNKANDLLDMPRAVTMFLTEGRMRNSSANMDVKKLESYERKVRAKHSVEHNSYVDIIATEIKDKFDRKEAAKVAVENRPKKEIKPTLPEHMRQYLEFLHEDLSQKTGKLVFNENFNEDEEPENDVDVDDMEAPQPAGQAPVWNPPPIMWPAIVAPAPDPDGRIPVVIGREEFWYRGVNEVDMRQAGGMRLNAIGGLRYVDYQAQNQAAALNQLGRNDNMFFHVDRAIAAIDALPGQAQQAPAEFGIEANDIPL